MTKTLALLAALLLASQAQAGVHYDYDTLRSLNSPSPGGTPSLPTPPQFNSGGLACGLPSLPPVGCDREQAVCLCATAGQCRWMYLGCR